MSKLWACANRNMSESELRLFYNIDPLAKARPRFTVKNGYARSYTPARTVDFANTIKILSCEQYKMPPIDTPIYMQIEFHIPTKNKKKIGEPHGVRPDIDNLIKNICDALNGIVYKDDGQIWKIHSTKHYAEKGSISIILES